MSRLCVKSVPWGGCVAGGALAGVAVTVSDTSGAVLASTQTDADGKFSCRISPRLWLRSSSPGMPQQTR